MAEYQLYCFAQSGNAYRAALMLNLIGADWEPKFVDYLAGGETRTPEYRTKVNEMGEAPVLLLPCSHRPALPAREALPEVEGQGFFELLDRVYATGAAFTARRAPMPAAKARIPWRQAASEDAPPAA